MIRAEKSTPNLNAYRTLVLGLILGVGMLVGIDPALRLWDQRNLPRPWFAPVIGIVPVPKGPPRVRYKANPLVAATGGWTAYVADAEGGRICTGRGTGSYVPSDADPVLWRWEEWLGRTDCAPPDEPYRLCVFYTTATVRSGVTDITHPFCSAVYDPKEGRR